MALKPLHKVSTVIVFKICMLGVQTSGETVEFKNEQNTENCLCKG